MQEIPTDQTLSPKDFLEITVKVSDSDQTLVQKFAEYNSEVRASKDCPFLKEMVESTIKKFKGSPEDVVVRIRMDW